MLPRIPSAQQASGWYELFQKIFADIKGAAFKNKQARLELYRSLFVAIRVIHVDYVSMFLDLMNDLENASSLEEVEAAKRRFYEARLERTKERALAMFDAKALAGSCEDPFESRFLSAVGHYIHGRSIEDHDLGMNYASRSREFWSQVRSMSQKNELISMVNNSVAAIATDYSKLFDAYSRVDPEAIGAQSPRHSRSER